MAEAAGWGLLASSSLLIGAVVGVTTRIKAPVIGLILGFGAGTLFSAVAFELTEEAYNLGGADAVAVGLAAGALAYFTGDFAIQRRGAEQRMAPGRRRSEGSPSQGTDSATALLFGAVLDGIPESAVLGISLLEGSVSIAVFAAILISNLPEGIGSSSGMRMEGLSVRHILTTWLVVVLVSGIAAAAGYGLLEGASDNTVALIEAFAGGAVLTMLVDTMIPEAHRDLGRATGLATVLGFALAYLLSTLD